MNVKAIIEFYEYIRLHSDRNTSFEEGTTFAEVTRQLSNGAFNPADLKNILLPCQKAFTGKNLRETRESYADFSDDLICGTWYRMEILAY